MTPQEKELITTLLGRLKQAGGQPKDPEAEALIRQALAEQPDAPYYLVQTVLIQDIALNQAQQRIIELERQCAQAAPPQKATSFLGGLFGAGAGRGDQPQGGGTVPSSGPWSRAPQPQSPPPQSPPPGAGPQAYGQPGYPQPGYPQPGYGGQPMMGMGMGQGGSGFLRSAAATAAGIAGGALLFQGIQSMFGPHGGGMLGGMAQQPGLSETVTNNYYGSDQGGADQGGAPPSDLQAADQGGYAPDPGYADQNVAADPGFASDQDFASDSGFGDDSDLV
jgi:hypothetical protein